MKRKEKPKIAKPPRPPRPPRQMSVTGRVVFYAVCGVVSAAAMAAGMRLLEEHVQRQDVVRTQEGQIALADKPQWMPRLLADQISSQLLPDYYSELSVPRGATREQIEAAYQKLARLLDPKVNKSSDAARKLIEVDEAYAVLSNNARRRKYDMGWANSELADIIYHRAKRNPWVRTISHVVARPPTDAKTCQIEVVATYHQPKARVQMERDYAFVSADGTRLPPQQVPRYVVSRPMPNGKMQVESYIGLSDVPPHVEPKPIHYITIYGCKMPAPAIGQKWLGQDLADGLRLVELVENRPYAPQITVVDLRNHGGSSPSGPRLRMWAQVGRGKATDIRFGQFPRYEGDYLVPPERKLAQLDQFVRIHGGQLGSTKDWLDVRYDRLHASPN